MYYTKIIGVLAIIVSIGNVVLGIVDYNWDAVIGWSVATLYVSLFVVDILSKK